MKKQFSLVLMLLIALFTTQSVFAQGNKKDPGISFEKDELDYTIGQEEPFVEPKLINPNNVPVYFVSDNASAASVDFATGKVTFITQGTVKITAVAEETEMFSYSQVSYTINVTDKSIIFAASFAKDDCGFTEYSEPGITGIWEHENDGYMKADGFGKVDNKKLTAFYLISPEFSLSNSGNSVSFGECGSYFGDRWNKEAQLVIREVGGEWMVIDKKYYSGDHNMCESTGDLTIPSELNGKKVQIAFKYSADGSGNSGVWHVRNLHVKSVANAKAETGIAFDKESVDYLMGTDQTFVAPKLINPNNLEVKYSSSDAKVATVDELTGEVSFVNEGTVVITAKSTETDKFMAGKASYTINVVKVSEGEYADPALRSTVVAIEFTGQYCMYCPEMARTLQKTQDELGKDRYIIAALHSLESYSNMNFLDHKLYNEEAAMYSDAMEANSGLPQLYYNSLGTVVDDHGLDEMYTLPDLLEINGSVVKTEGNKYDIVFNTLLRSDRKEFVKDKQIDVLLWTLENNIEALQYEGSWSVVKHNHIFRGSLNTTWGEAYKVGSVYKNTVSIPESVLDSNNTEVVVLFLDHETRAILDAHTFAVSDNGASGIEEIKSDSENDSAIYDLSGRKVNNITKGGVYIKNGKKYIVK